jgi:hypothetical protein
MREATPARSPDSRPGLSGTAIKYIGAVLMVFDHLHQFFIAQGAPAWFNMLGRPVLPIFLFMVAEGFYYTRSRKRYLLQLLAGFALMNIANLALTAALPLDNLPAEATPTLMNNVFATMLVTAFCLLAITILREGVKERKSGKIAAGVLLLLLPLIVTAIVAAVMVSFTDPLVFVIISFIPNLLTLEGGYAMVVIGALFYLLRRYRLAQMAVIAVFSALSFIAGLGGGYNIQWMMVFAIIPLAFYNGKRGRGGRFDKYFFYIFYPAHIYLFYIIAWFLQR